MQTFEIHQPESPEAVCACLRDYGETAAIHAGGTDLLVRLREGAVNPDHVIDLSRIVALKSIDLLKDGGLRIGGMAALTQISTHAGLSVSYQALHEALESIGSLQIRNRGTLVGNICNASPAADSVPPLLIYDATVNVRGSQGVRKISVKELITGPGETCLEQDEFVESVDLPPAKAKMASAYLKIGRRKAVDCSIVGVAVRIDKEGAVRAAFGAVAATPIRIERIENILSGRKWDDALVDKAAEEATRLVQPIDDIRASKAYRRDMSAVLFKRALSLAKERLAATG